MSKREYVEFTGILPKELIGAKKPLYGRVVKKSKSGLLTIKPKYRDYEVTVDKADVTEITKDKFSKKHKKKKSSTPKKPVVVKKPAAKKPKVEKVTKPTTVKVKHPNGSESKPKPKAKNGMKPCETKKDFPGVSKAAEEAKDTLQKTPPPITKPVIKEEPVVKGDPRNWVKDDPINNPESKTEATDDVVDTADQNSGGALVYVVIAIIAAIAIGAYFLFF